MIMSSLIAPPTHIHSRAEVLGRPCPVPAQNGLYAWYFNNVPQVVIADGCSVIDGKTLLYIGIAPDWASKPSSRQSLLNRIRYHYRGNAEGSTLRRTLGVLLAEKSGFPLRRVGSGKRITLTHAGERYLDEWMGRNAFVAWVVCPEPWVLERALLSTHSCPVNLKDNNHHPFASTLSSWPFEPLNLAAADPNFPQTERRP